MSENDHSHKNMSDEDNNHYENSLPDKIYQFCNL